MYTEAQHLSQGGTAWEGRGSIKPWLLRILLTLPTAPAAAAVSGSLSWQPAR